MNTTEPTTLILAGDGYQLTIAPEAEARKRELLAAAAAVTTVSDNDESHAAQFQSRRLAALRIEVEKSRKLVKEPVNRIGKLIDKTAADFIAAVEQEEKRITQLVGEHAQEVARQKAEAERIEREAFEAARAAREAAEAGGIAAALAAKKAAAERLAASDAVAETNVASGVRFAVDYEIVDIRAFLNANPHLCEIHVKRSETLAWLKEWLAEDMDRDRVAGTPLGLHVCGIRAFKKPVVSTR